MKMLRLCLLILLISSAMMAIDAAAIPIWELLTHEEKVNYNLQFEIFEHFCKMCTISLIQQMGRLFYVFVHLVQQYCKTSDIPGKATSTLFLFIPECTLETTRVTSTLNSYKVTWQFGLLGPIKVAMAMSGFPYSISPA